MASISKRKNSPWYYLVYWDVTQKQVWKALPGLTKKQAQAVAKRKTQEIKEKRRKVKSVALHLAQLEEARGIPLDGVLTPAEAEQARRADMQAQGHSYLTEEEEWRLEEEAMRLRLGTAQAPQLPPELSIDHLTKVVFPRWLADGLLGRERIASYTNVLHVLSSETQGRLANLAAIRPEHGDGLAKLLKKNKSRSVGTVGTYMKTLRAIFSMLIKQRLYTGENPVKWDRRLTPSNPLDTSVPTAEEMAVLLEKLKGLDASVYQGVYLMQCNGLRVGEVCALRWEHRAGDVIYVRNSKTSKPGKEHLDRGVHVQDIADAGIPSASSGPVLLNPRTKRAYTRETFRARLYKCLEEADLGRINPHKFRHYFGTSMALNGANRHQIQAAMGHSSSTMSDRYVHIKGSIRDIREMAKGGKGRG